MNKSYSFTLPLGPSVNHYLGRVGHRSFLTPKAKKFIEAVKVCVAPFVRERGALSYPLKVEVRAYLPDKRRRDVVNYEKTSSDALTRAGFWLDDTLIWDYRIIRAGFDKKNPRLEFMVTRYE